jgi:hypothetical protein
MKKIILAASAFLSLGGMGTAFAHSPTTGGGLPVNSTGPVYGSHAFDNQPAGAHRTGETVFSLIFGHSKTSPAVAHQPTD